MDLPGSSGSSRCMQRATTAAGLFLCVAAKWSSFSKWADYIDTELEKFEKSKSDHVSSCRAWLEMLCQTCVVLNRLLLLDWFFSSFLCQEAIPCKITKQQEVFIDTVSLLDRKGVMTLFDVFSLD